MLIYRNFDSKKTIFTFLLTFLFVTTAHANEIDDGDLSAYNWLDKNDAIANQHIVPLYRELAKSTTKLSESIEQICMSGEGAVINGRVERHFKNVYLDWSTVQHIKFGPISFLKRQERFQYWPDKHSSGERQLRQLLQAIEQGDALSLQNFQKKSVAVQGLTALERMLYSSDGLISAQECDLALLISANLAQISNELDQNWRLAPVDFANEFVLADRGEGTYESSDEVANLLADAFVTQLLLVSEYKLGRGLAKKTGGRIYPKRLEAWRSELSIDLTKASITSLYSFFKIAYRARLKVVDAKLSRQIGTSFKHIIRGLKKVSKPMSAALETEKGVAQITMLKDEVKELELLVRNDMFAKLGFAKRFNSLDGD